MKNKKLLRGILLFIFIFFATGLVFVGTKKFDSSIFFLKNFRIYSFSKLNVFSYLLSNIGSISTLTQENIVLKMENTKLQTQLASQDEFREQIIFLKEALDLEVVAGHHLIDARSFNLQFTPKGHTFLVNKGTISGVRAGNIIISSSGILVGIVSSTEEDFSRADLVSNLDLKVTIKVLGKNTIGIAHGILAGGLLVDFISKNDSIEEGDLIVTNGNDLFPPGLLVGRVSKITDNNDGELFKNVVIEPEYNNVNLDRVLILQE